MKFRVGDKVIITGGKDKGKTAAIAKVLPTENKVLVTGVNMYVKHQKPMGEREGQKVLRERPLPTAKVAILNDKNQPDRIGYQVGKDGQKVRIFKKSGQVITTQTQPAKAEAAKPAKTEKAKTPKKK
jgi:large subunit ribosomal protein L24